MLDKTQANNSTQSPLSGPTPDRDVVPWEPTQQQTHNITPHTPTNNTIALAQTDYMDIMSLEHHYARLMIQLHQDSRMEKFIQQCQRVGLLPHNYVLYSPGISLIHPLPTTRTMPILGPRTTRKGNPPLTPIMSTPTRPNTSPPWWVDTTPVQMDTNNHYTLLAESTTRGTACSKGMGPIQAEDLDMYKPGWGTAPPPPPFNSPTYG